METIDTAILSTFESRFCEKSTFRSFEVKKFFQIVNIITNEITTEKTNKPAIRIIFSGMIKCINY